ncbi:MAG: glycosyl hydrolase family 25 [Lactobacillus sp.]|jgi:GH25 family lysozyme M1 (1,4-beta-N-acetylmuramidase)|nr:glycosyl hydrolase family 25 [Lactobacillus sp.]
MSLAGVDVSSYQPADLTKYAMAGAKFAIVKLTQNINYTNPNAKAQLASAKAHQMLQMGYFYANFSANSAQALAEAGYSINVAKRLGLPSGAYLAVDWEDNNGNSVKGPRGANTSAILTAMRIIKQAGYRPLLYSGAFVLRNYLNLAAVIKEFPNSLWVASYPLNGAVYQPNMAYFPSMDGVAIWQYTDNWHGMSVDGNVAVIDLKNGSSKEEDDEMSWHPTVKYNELGLFKVNRLKGATLYADKTLTKPIGQKPYGSVFKIFKASDGAVNGGGDQWFSQADGLTKINPLAVNPMAHAICQVTAADTWTQNLPKPGQKGVGYLAKGSTWKVLAREKKYLLIGDEQVGKYVDGDKCVIVL